MASEGERPQYRQGMERLTSQLVSSGMKPSVAEKLARESVTRIDRKRDDQGLGPPPKAR
jgi:hypothetical protein